jgi:hypothetical protein
MHIDVTSGSTACQGPLAAGQTGRDSSLENPETALLPDPMLSLLTSGDPMEKIAALLTHSSRQDRKNARESAALEERNIMEEGRKRVKAMRDKADEIRKEAWVNGTVGVVSGSAMIASAALAQQDASDAAKKESSAVAKPGETSPTANQQAVDASTTAAPDASAPQEPKIDRAKLVEGGAKIFSGVGEIVAGAYRAEQQECDGDAAEHEMLAQAATRRKEEYDAQARDAGEMLRKIADFLRDVRSAQNEASKAAIYRA